MRLRPARFCRFMAIDAAEEAAEVGGQERHPGEQRDLLQIEVAHVAEIERQPEGERAPGGVGQKSRERDAPEVALPSDLQE